MAHLKQTLTIHIPEGIMDQLYYSKVSVASGSYLGGAAEVYSELSGAMGVLVYYPGVSLKSLAIK